MTTQSSTMLRLTTRGPKVANAIHDMVPFKTSGALSADKYDPPRHHTAGMLRGPDMERFFADSDRIDYIVWSYATPIAWHVSDPRTIEEHQSNGWYKVAQRFSVTTSKHQGNLYLV